MRRRIFEGRARAGRRRRPWPTCRQALRASAAPSAESQTLLHLPVRELLLLGLLENRGHAARRRGVWRAVGDRAAGMVLGTADQRRSTRRACCATRRDSSADGQLPPLLADRRHGRRAAGLWSWSGCCRWCGWAPRCTTSVSTRVGNDLRAEYGLLTRVTATIPLRAHPDADVRESPLQRLVGRASVRVETAGGAAGGRRTARSVRASGWRRSSGASAVPELVRRGDAARPISARSTGSRCTRAPSAAPSSRCCCCPACRRSLLVALVGWRLWPAVASAIAISGALTRQAGAASGVGVERRRRGAAQRLVVAQCHHRAGRQDPDRDGRPSRRSIGAPAMAGVRVDTAGGREASHAACTSRTWRARRPGRCSRGCPRRRRRPRSAGSGRTRVWSRATRSTWLPSRRDGRSS